MTGCRLMHSSGLSCKCLGHQGSLNSGCYGLLLNLSISLYGLNTVFDQMIWKGVHTKTFASGKGERRKNAHPDKAFGK